MNKVVLIGSGGHSKVVRDIIEANKDLKLHAILDQKFVGKKTVDDITFANINFIDTFFQSNYKFCIAIGNNEVRKGLVEQLGIPVDNFVTLIHPSAIISASVSVGNGSVVMPGAIINADTVIGNHSIVNSGAIIEHDNKLKDYVHVSPNATLAGAVQIGEGTHVGSGATVIPGKSIGDWSTVGAGAVVVKDVTDEVTVVGVPAK